MFYTQVLINITYILIVFINLTFCDSCQWEKQTISCNNVDYNMITQVKIYNFTTAIINNCNLPKWNNSAQLPFAPTLRTLEMHCNIREVSDNILQNLTQLQELNLSQNDLVTMPINTFPLNNDIKTLTLSRNKIKFGRNSANMLHNLKNLNQLDLSLNRIDYVRGVFYTLGNLQTLNLSNNAMSVLLDGTFDFSKMHNLKEIDLSFNYIREIMPDAYTINLGSYFPLRMLNLKNNLIQNLPDSFFERFQNLNELNLANNRFTSLSANIFKSLINLKSLTLSGNAITGLPLGIFDALINMDELDLSRMKLSHMNGNIFSKNQKIQRLDLSNNKIVNLESETFQSLTNMIWLNISHNELTTFPKRMFEGTGEEHHLEQVDFSYNKIANIETDIFNMESLTDINARGNRLKTLNADIFATCTFPLLNIDLRDNRLVNIDLEFFEWSPNLERFEMTGNPWECKCFDELLKFLNKRNIEYTKIGYFDGIKSTCIALNQFECKVDEKHYDKYYELYVKANRT